MNFDFTAELNQEQMNEAIAAYVLKNSPQGYMCSAQDVEILETRVGCLIAQVSVKKLITQDI